MVEKDDQSGNADGNVKSNKASAATTGKDGVAVSKPTFKPRKRPARKKKMRSFDPGPADGEELSTGVNETGDLLMLKEAQTLRERARQAGLSMGAVTRRERANGEDALRTADATVRKNDVADGLKSHFSVEKSGTALEERMAKFIEDGMRKKFGDRYNNTTNHTMTSTDGTFHSLNEVFEIPDHLKVQQRPLYDPSEGMPSAGLEEAEIPGTDGRRNHSRVYEKQNDKQHADAIFAERFRKRWRDQQS